jgi:hypothetical protein
LTSIVKEADTTFPTDGNKVIKIVMNEELMIFEELRAKAEEEVIS